MADQPRQPGADGPDAPAHDLDAPSPAVQPSHALALLRVLWGALLIGQLLIAAMAVMLMHNAQRQPMDESMAYKLFAVNWGMLVMGVLAGSHLRNQIYKRFWRGQVVAPVGYFTGNVLMFALLEAVVLMSLVVSMLTMGFWPWALPGVAALAVYAVNFPHGGPMFAAYGQAADAKADKI